MEEISFLNCPSLTDSQIENLQRNGITTILDFISAQKDVVCNATQMDHSDYYITRQKMLEKIQPYPVTARQLCTRERMTPTSTGLPRLDKILGGGIFPRDIIELYGKTGSGKTQLSLFLTSQFCSNLSCVLYFDMKNDFNAQRLYNLCGNDEKILANVKVFKEGNLKELMSTLDCIKNEFIGGIDSFLSKCRFLVIDSVPMAIYPSVQNDFYSWRYHQEQLMRKLHWLADKLNLAVVLVNHAVSLRDVSGNSREKVKPAMGKYWQSKTNISIRLQKVGYANRFKATLDKCYRNTTGQEFDFSVGPNKLF